MAWRLSVATVSTARVLFVTGKGGVGKTTVAELLAKAAGIGGRPARLIDTCGRSDDGSDDRAVVEALITRLVGLRAVSRRMLDSRSFQALLAAIPGLVDIARLDAIRRLSKKERVVVDGPASGQAAAMLLAPARLGRLALVGPVRRLASELARFVADPAKVSVVVVASPEEMAIAEAREHGDLSENAEYHAARERQSYIEGRLAELEDVISRSDVIDTSKLTGDVVYFGATVLVVDEDTDEESTYQIVGAHEADAEAGKLSVTSPLARALIGKKLGDLVEVETPRGHKAYKICKVSFK